MFIVFNRPDLTIRVINRLKQLKPMNLYVSMDGPRSDNRIEMENCDKVKYLIKNAIDWPCNLRLNLMTENLGPRGGPCKAYDWFFDAEEEGIILEDDSLPELSFFHYCSDLLDYYRNDTRIFSINGNNFGYDIEKNETYGFTRFMSAWGWATWKRSYRLVDYSLCDYKKKLFPKLFLASRLNRFHDLDIGRVNHWYEVLKLVYFDKNKYWDYQWMLTQIFFAQFSIFPYRNLVSNIGFDGLGTNLNDCNDPMSNRPTHPFVGPLVHPTNFQIDYLYESEVIKPIWRYYKYRLGVNFYLKNFIYRGLKKIHFINEN